MHVMTEQLTESTLPRWDQLEIIFRAVFCVGGCRHQSLVDNKQKCLFAGCTEGRQDVWLARCLELGVALRRLPAACAKQ